MQTFCGTSLQLSSLLRAMAVNWGLGLVVKVSCAGQNCSADALSFSMLEEGPNPGNNAQGVRNLISEQKSSVLCLFYKIHPAL